MQFLKMSIVAMSLALVLVPQALAQTAIASATDCPAFAGKSVKGMWDLGRSLDLQISSVRRDGDVCLAEGSYKYGSWRGTPGGESKIVRMTVTESTINVELQNSKASFRIEGGKVKGSWRTNNSPATVDGSFNLM